MGSKKQTWGLSDLEPKLIANQISAFLQLESNVRLQDPFSSYPNIKEEKQSGYATLMKTVMKDYVMDSYLI